LESYFNEEDYIKEEVIIDITKANIFALPVVALLVIVFGIPYYLLWHERALDGIRNFGFSGILFRDLFFFLTLIVGIVLHELIHGVFFAIFTKHKFKSIKFGFMPASKLFTPYCHCKEPLKINQYRICGIMPLIILGIIPAIISLFTGNLFLFCIGIFFTAAAAGDVLIIQKTLKEEKDSLLFDHPSEAGYYIYRLKNKESNT